MQSTTLVCLTFAVTTMLGIAGCGGESETKAECPTNSGKTPAAAHFKADVLPLMQRACGLSASCHGDTTSPNDPQIGYRPYLGPKDTVMATAMDITMILGVIVDKQSPAEPDMKI